MTRGHWIRLLLAAGVLGAAGCLQLETTVKLNEDGGATVTERLAFSRRLLDMAKGDKGQAPIESLLTREAANERTKLMGKGVTVASHELRDGEKGARECVTVYQVPDLAEFVYTSPFLVHGGAGGIKFGMAPQTDFNWHGWWPGQLFVSFTPVAIPAPGDKPAADPTPVGGATPLDMQMIRDLVPVFGDMLGDVELSLKFESYATIQRTDNLAHRGRSSWVNHVHLIRLTGKDMDKYGYDILRNEEIMREVLLGRLGGERDKPNYGSFLTDNLREMEENVTLPIVHQGWGGRVAMAPSLPLFKRYFEGKTLDWTGTERADIKARGKKPADFKEIGGWEKAAVVHKPVEVDNCPTNCPWCR